MYHPTRGGVRGGRDQFNWDDVKVDKHRENYLGHSLKAPVGRWQKGKDLHWYARGKGSSSDAEAAKEEIQRIKEEEEQAMREALGLTPKRATRTQGNRLDKHEFSELVKRGSTAEDVGEGHAEAAHVQGLGFAKPNRPHVESGSTEPAMKQDVPSQIPRTPMPPTPLTNTTSKVEEESENDGRQKKRMREDKKHEKKDRHEKREKREKREKHERRHSSDEKRKHRKDKERRRHDSGSD